jgi:hypothetical protein
MCGRFTFAISPELLANLFGISILEDFPRFNLMEIIPFHPSSKTRVTNPPLVSNLFMTETVP